ncbi:MAG: Trm112 family protein [Candidatus Omnitrophica bacterium]|nr:Trm112 family protein [Candidatus Omnitrophota bacterium]
MALDVKFIEILACPKCKSTIRENDSWLVCQNSACGLQYPIRDGIPVMLIQEAKPKS